jgi:hypothetical protein
MSIKEETISEILTEWLKSAFMEQFGDDLDLQSGKCGRDSQRAVWRLSVHRGDGIGEGAENGTARYCGESG